MAKRSIAALAICAGLAGCGGGEGGGLFGKRAVDESVNPLIPQQNAITSTFTEDTPELPMQKADALLSARLDRTPTGAIVQADVSISGAVPAGATMRRVKVQAEPQTLYLDVMVTALPTRAPLPQPARSVSLATKLSSAELAGLTRVVLLGANGSIVLRP